MRFAPASPASQQPRHRRWSRDDDLLALWRTRADAVRDLREVLVVFAQDSRGEAVTCVHGREDGAWCFHCRVSTNAATVVNDMPIPIDETALLTRALELLEWWRHGPHGKGVMFAHDAFLADPAIAAFKARTETPPKGTR